MRGEGDGNRPGSSEVPGKGKEAADSLKAALDEMKASLSPWTMISNGPGHRVILTWPGRSTVLSSSWAQGFPCPKGSPAKAMALFNSFNEVTGIFKVDPLAGFFWKIPQRKNQRPRFAQPDYRHPAGSPQKKDWATADGIGTALKNWVLSWKIPPKVRWKNKDKWK